MRKFAMSFFAGAVAVLAPNAAFACACGCGVFDVGTSSMIPHGAGGMAFFEFAFQDQNRNWANSGPANAANNNDRDIRTEFLTFGLQYMFNRSWGLQVELPYDFRNFKTLGGPTGDRVQSLKWSSFGDVRLEGIYTGFSEDMSIGLTFGVKLPTGGFSHNDAYNDIDRDTELGTGSTDFLLGAFDRHHLAGRWTWFAQANLDVPTLIQNQYRPGIELDAAFGVYHAGWKFGGVKITPLAQLIGSVRTSDSGNYAAGGLYSNPGTGRASGYQRLMVSPGIEFDFRRFSVYADVEKPVVQDFVGNQLAASWLLKCYVTYKF